MKRWLPSPLMSLALLVAWLLFNQTLSFAHILLGALLAVLIPQLLRGLQPLPAFALPRPLALLKLLVLSLIEIIRSCFNVSRIILFGMPEGVESRFVRVPLELKDPYGLALLSCLLNSTPGTVWVEILPDSGDLAVHVFDLHDEDWWLKTIKRRYEHPLIEAFEGRKVS